MVSGVTAVYSGIQVSVSSCSMRGGTYVEVKRHQIGDVRFEGLELSLVLQGLRHRSDGGLEVWLCTSIHQQTYTRMVNRLTITKTVSTPPCRI